MEDYIRSIEERELPELRQKLASLESGVEHLAVRKGVGPWVDTTQEWIDHLKETIGYYEHFVASLRRGE